MSIYKLFLIFGASTTLLLTTCYSQTFDPDVEDKEYLDSIQLRLRQEVKKAHGVLVNQTRVLQNVTKAFIESKIKENLFKAVRARVEMELDMMAENNVSFRQARQEDTEDDDDGTTTPRPPPQGLLPQLANVVSTLFGTNVNVTSYIREATSFLPPDISYRIVSAASLIDPQRFTSTSTTTPGPVVVAAVVNNSAYINYQTGIVPPETALQAGSGSHIPQSGADRVVQGVAQSSGATQHVPSGSVVVPHVITPEGVIQAPVLPVSEVHPISPIESTNAATQAAAAAGVPSRTKLVQAQQVNPAEGIVTVQSLQAIPAPGAIIIQPEVPLNNLNQQAPPPFQSLSERGNSEEEEDTSSDIETTERVIQNEEDSGEIEDDSPIARDDTSRRTEPPRSSLISGYPALSYAFKLFNRINSRSQIPTTTEYMNVTKKSLDSLEEEEQRATSPATTTFQTIVQSGIYIYEGAREAYTLLQQLNKFLDRVGDRLDSAGIGVEPVAIPGGGGNSREE